MSYPVSLSEVKSHLRIDINYLEDDNYIQDIIIPAAVQYCNNIIDSSTLIIDSSCPYTVKQAILITAGDLYDVERSSYTLGSIKRSDVIERLLIPYKNIVW